jgi:hypothetical protein
VFGSDSFQDKCLGGGGMREAISFSFCNRMKQSKKQQECLEKLLRFVFWTPSPSEFH